MLSERRLRDWVALLDFEIASVYGYLGSMPMTRLLPTLRTALRVRWSTGRARL
jgi:hypothetical protein